MSEQGLRPKPSRPSAGGEAFGARLRRPPRGRSEDQQPYGLILAALGGIGLILLAFV